ncbi:MAG: LysR family transcriptional regulator [Pseudomonadota bacterium]
MNIPTDLLRCFVTVADLGGFTRAARALGRTQPAISLQVRRLEELLQAKLFHTSRRQVALTEAGLALGPYARQMLRLNDDILAHFGEAALTGLIRVGVPTDFAHAFLLDAITRFASENIEVRIEIESKLSSELRRDIAGGALDIAVAIAPDDEAPYLVESALVSPFWAVKDSFVPDAKAPLPIVRHPDPCEYATRMRNALRRSGRGWRTVFVSRDVAGLQAALQAGLGATALTPATYLPGLRPGRPEEGFPTLLPLRIGLFYKHTGLSDAGNSLAQSLLEHINSSKSIDFG